VEERCVPWLQDSAAVQALLKLAQELSEEQVAEFKAGSRH
jgi:hypothetical protein